MARKPPGHPGCVIPAAWLLLSAAPAFGLQPGNVLLVYNSRNAESLAIREAYVAARPGVLQLDLNDPGMPVGSVSRSDYLARIRNPIRNFINGIAGPDVSQQVMAIATTRGLPARILSSAGGADEFELYSRWSSVESELALLQQDLEAGGSAYLSNRFSGCVFNPYWRMPGTPIASFTRAAVKTPRPFVNVLIPPGPEEVWQVTDLTPGDIYLVCRLDAAPTPAGNSAAQNAAALIQRSLNLVVDRCGVQALFDEYGSPPPPAGFDLDDGEFFPLFPDRADFENASAFLNAFGIASRHDHTFNFITGPELADQARRVLALGTYGENHDFLGWGENPPGNGSYVNTYEFHPAAVFVAYESWSGTSIYTGGPGREDQQQCLDFIARGGSFTVGSVMEPFAYFIPDMQDLLPGLFFSHMTYAEAVYASLPVLSWQLIPVGDPLARVSVVGPGPAPAVRPVGCPGDADRNGVVNFADVTKVITLWGQTCAAGSSVGDANNDGVVEFADVTKVLELFGNGCEQARATAPATRTTPRFPSPASPRFQ